MITIIIITITIKLPMLLNRVRVHEGKHNTSKHKIPSNNGENTVKRYREKR